MYTKVGEYISDACGAVVQDRKRGGGFKLGYLQIYRAEFRRENIYGLIYVLYYDARPTFAALVWLNDVQSTYLVFTQSPPLNKNKIIIAYKNAVTSKQYFLFLC